MRVLTRKDTHFIKQKVKLGKSSLSEHMISFGNSRFALTDWYYLHG